jgi:hypothetical protein
MLFKEIIFVYSDNNMELVNKKIQRYLLLEWMVHIGTMWL